jgi:hypothetical protein
MRRGRRRVGVFVEKRIRAAEPAHPTAESFCGAADMLSGKFIERQVHNEWISDDDRERLEALHAAACQGTFNNRHIEF